MIKAMEVNMVMVVVLTSLASRNLGMLRMMERRRAGMMKMAVWIEEEEDTCKINSLSIIARSLSLIGVLL